MKQFIESPNFLQTVVAEAKENSEAARMVTADLTEAQLNWKPSSEQWSIAQCLEHLAITSGKFDDYFSSTLERAQKQRPVTNTPAYQPSMVGGWLARQVNPDGGRNLPAPKVFRPSEVSNIHTPLKLFIDQQLKFIDFVCQCDCVDYNKTRLRSPVTPLMRYSLADAFVITVLHAKRHLGQACRVREMPQFPRS